MSCLIPRINLGTIDDIAVLTLTGVPSKIIKNNPSNLGLFFIGLEGIRTGGSLVARFELIENVSISLLFYILPCISVWWIFFTQFDISF